MVIVEATVAAVKLVTTAMMNSSSNHDESNASVDSKIDLSHPASSERSDISSPWTTICLNR